MALPQPAAAPSPSPSPAHLPSKNGGLRNALPAFFYALKRTSPIAESRQPGAERGRTGQGGAAALRSELAGCSSAFKPGLGAGSRAGARATNGRAAPGAAPGRRSEAARAAAARAALGAAALLSPPLARCSVCLFFPRPAFLPPIGRHGAGSLAGAVGPSAHLQDHRHRGLQRGQDLLDGALLRRHLPRQHRGHHRRGFQGEGGGDRRRAHQGPGVGHSRPREVPEEHGGALLPQRPRCGLCLRRHKNGVLPQPEKLDRGVQRPRRPGSRPQSARGKQV